MAAVTTCCSSPITGRSIRGSSRRRAATAGGGTRAVRAARPPGRGGHPLEPGAPLLERAMALRQRAWTHADRVVLHVHPWSVVPVVALGIAGGPPVMLLNHLSQKFWVGGSVADLVLNLRDSALEWSAAYRGIARNALLP